MKPLSSSTAKKRMALAGGELLELLSRATTRDGTFESALHGLRFQRVSKPSSCRRKWHTFGPSLTLVAQGRKTSTYEGVKLTYDPSHILVVTGEAEFEGTILEASRERPYLAFSYRIPPDVVAKHLMALCEAKVTPITEPIPAFVGALEPSILECAVRLLRAIEDPIDRAVLAPLAIDELVFRLLRTDAAAAMRSAVVQDRDAEKVQNAMTFLRVNVEHPLTVEDVARHVAMSPSHFAHRFRAIARVSPMRYLKHQRLHHARTLLIADGLRVSEAAARAGYESMSHFTRDFRGYFGASPGEYTRNFRESTPSQDLATASQKPALRTRPRVPKTILSKAEDIECELLSLPNTIDPGP